MKGKNITKDRTSVKKVGNFNPIEKEGSLYLINARTKKVLGNSSIDSFENNLKVVAFVIIKEGKRQLVSLNGKILSESTTGEFTWRCEEGAYNAEKLPPNIIIGKETLDKRWYVNTKTGRIKETIERFL